RDSWAAARGVAIGCLIAALTAYFMHPVRGFPLPRGVAALDFLLLLAFVAGSRLLARTVTERPAPGRLVVRGKEVIVVGAGDAAWQVVRQMLRTPELGYTPIGLIDDDPKKRHIQLEGVRVIGTTGELPHVLRDNPPDEILIAIPSAPGELRELVAHGETPLFEIERGLVGERDFAAVVPVLGDVKSEAKMRQVFETYRPGVVFHAAAYKHVPMMEANPLESVRNNVLATKMVAD